MCMLRFAIEEDQMTTKEHKELMTSIWAGIIETRDSGQKEYAHDEDNCFQNFEKIAKQLNLDRKQVLWVYLMKHIDGILAFINGHESQREDVRGRLTDVIVYLTLLWGMIEEDTEEDDRKELLKRPEWKPQELEKLYKEAYCNEKADK